jgi:glycosyltransferase involved in cell wall biosynthesis
MDMCRWARAALQKGAEGSSKTRGIGSNGLSKRGRELGMRSYNDCIQRFALQGLLPWLLQLKETGMYRRKIYPFVVRTRTGLKLVCIGGRLSAGRARNVAATLARGDVFSFLDADDRELPIRNQLIQNMFTCYEKLQVLFHSFSR